MKIRINTKDIDLAISALTEYKDSLKDKERRIREKVAQLLSIEAEYNFSGASYNDIVDQGFEGVQIKVHVRNENSYSVVFTNQLEAIFIEFGAGVHYNGPAGSSPHPSASKNAFYIGSYGYGYGKYDTWSFKGPNGEYITTYGTPASMPLFHAIEYIIPEIPTIAKFVFKGEL